MFHLFFHGFFVHTSQAQTQSHFVEDHGFADHLVGILHHIADLLGALLDGLSLKGFTLEEDLTLCFRDEAADDLSQGALTGAVGAHDTDHFTFPDGEVDVFQNFAFSVVLEMQSLDLQNGRLFFLGRCSFLRRIPGNQRIAYHGKLQSFHTAGTHILGDLHTGIFEGGGIQGFANAKLGQNAGGNQCVGGHIRYDAAFRYYDDPVHMAVEHILQTMLNDDDGFVVLLLDPVNQINGGLAGGGV